MLCTQIHVLLLSLFAYFTWVVFISGRIMIMIDSCMLKIDVVKIISGILHQLYPVLRPGHTVQHCVQHCALTWKLHHLSALETVARNVACNCCRSRIGSYFCTSRATPCVHNLQHCVQLRDAMFRAMMHRVSAPLYHRLWLFVCC